MTRPNLIRCGFVLLGVAMLLGLPACQNHPMNHANVQTELEMNKDVDLGIILDTTQPLHLTIPITNRANRPITIQKLAKDCSCTSVKIDKLLLAPGETANLTVVTNLTGKTSFYEGNIIIESDAVERVDQIRVRGQITGQIRIRPARATVLVGDRPAPAEFSVFCDEQNGPWRYTGFTSGDPGLAIELKRREASPTTSVYDGIVDLAPGIDDKAYSRFQTLWVTLSFVNDQLNRHLDLKYGIDLVARRNVAIDPAQVMFLSGTDEQKRTVMVQSLEGASIDAARCTSSAIKTTIRRIDPRTISVELVYHPEAASESASQNLLCELLSDGKTIGIVPIKIIEIP